MKKKSEKLEGFIHGLHKHIVNNRQFRKNTAGKSELQIQTEIRPLIVDYLKEWFKNEGVVDFEGKAHDSFYWEGQEGRNKDKRQGAFGAFNYPDFIIKRPYNIAVEYKQSPNGSIVKHGSHYRSCGDRVDHSWRELLGQRAMNLTDHTKMSEVIVSTIQANEGFSKDDIISSWDGKTKDVVAHALKDTDIMVRNSGSGVITFE